MDKEISFERLGSSETLIQTTQSPLVARRRGSWRLISCIGAIGLLICIAPALSKASNTGVNQSTQLVFQCFDESDPVLGGRDLVAYHSLSFAEAGVMGSEEFGVRKNGLYFLFSSSQNRDTFLTDPEYYMPAWGAFCAWSVAEEYWDSDGHWPAGDYKDSDTWAIVNNRLFFFHNKQARDDFLTIFKDSPIPPPPVKNGQPFNNLALDLQARISKGDRTWNAFFGTPPPFIVAGYKGRCRQN